MSSNEPKLQENFADSESETGREPPVDPRDEVLVAYLDGELSDAETERIETQLAGDAELRQRLCNLQATWDMLDELPHKEPDRAFLKSTIEMVVTSAQKKKVKWHRWPIRIGLMLAAFALASLVAFQVVRSVQTRPYRQFVANLDFLENVDVYGQIQDVSFLEALQRSGLFAADGGPGSHNRVNAGDDRNSMSLPNERRLSLMTTVQIAQLKQTHRAFELNPPESQQHLRQMHQRIVDHPDRESLMETARAYVAWLQTISAENRFEIAKTPVTDRIKKVLEVREEQINELFGRQGPTSLPLQDVDPLSTWWIGFMEDKQDVALEKIKELVRGRSQAFEGMDALRRFEVLMTRGAAFDFIDEEDVNELKSVVSKPASDTLSQHSLEDQRVLIERWLRSATATTREVSDEERWSIYVDLTDDQKSSLDGLPRDELKSFLSDQYRKEHPPKFNIWRLFQKESKPEGGNAGPSLKSGGIQG